MAAERISAYRMVWVTYARVVRAEVLSVKDREFVLAARVAKPWPGAKEPGESHDAAAARDLPRR